MSGLNYMPDLATLARGALLRELIDDGVPQDEAQALAGRLEIRLRNEGRQGVVLAMGEGGRNDDLGHEVSIRHPGERVG
jgi:hypothetical protein